MIRSLRKQHRRTFLVLAVVLGILLIRAFMSRPDWPHEAANARHDDRALSVQAAAITAVPIRSPVTAPATSGSAATVRRPAEVRV